jgi:hypothetical protein
MTPSKLRVLPNFRKGTKPWIVLDEKKLPGVTYSWAAIRFYKWWN